MELFALVLAIATLASAAADPAVNSGGLTPDLAKWLSQRESPAKISAKIAQDVFPGMGFGLKAEEAVVANETLMEVPASALLSMKTASEGKLKGVVEELLRSNCSANSVLALHLLHEAPSASRLRFTLTLSPCPGPSTSRWPGPQRSSKS